MDINRKYFMQIREMFLPLQILINEVQEYISKMEFNKFNQCMMHETMVIEYNLSRK